MILWIFGWREGDDEKLVRLRCFLSWLTKIVSLQFRRENNKEKRNNCSQWLNYPLPFYVLDVLCCLPSSFFFFFFFFCFPRLALSFSFFFFFFCSLTRIEFFFFLLLFFRHDFSFLNKFGWFFLGYLPFFVSNGHYFLTMIYE